MRELSKITIYHSRSTFKSQIKGRWKSHFEGHSAIVWCLIVQNNIHFSNAKPTGNIDQQGQKIFVNILAKKKCLGSTASCQLSWTDIGILFFLSTYSLHGFDYYYKESILFSNLFFFLYTTTLSKSVLLLAWGNVGF